MRLPGRLPLDRAAAWTGATWTGRSDTVGGLVLERLGRVPQPGERLEIEGVPVEVESVEHNEVESVLVRPAPGVEGG